MLEEALEQNDFEYALRIACDIAYDDRREGNHSEAKRMIAKACELVKENPTVNIGWLYFGQDKDCHAVYRAWREVQPSEIRGRKMHQDNTHTWRTIREHDSMEGRLVVERCDKCDSGRTRFETRSGSETLEEYASRAASECERVDATDKKAMDLHRRACRLAVYESGFRNWLEESGQFDDISTAVVGSRTVEMFRDLQEEFLKEAHAIRREVEEFRDSLESVAQIDWCNEQIELIGNFIPEFERVRDVYTAALLKMKAELN